MQTQQTTLRIDTNVLNALRLARAELIVATRSPIFSDNDSIMALLAYWDGNKRDTHAITSGPVLTMQSEAQEQLTS